MHSPAPPQKRPTLLALIVAAAFFMEILDGAIISPAIPEIAASFGSTAVAVSTGISSYLITVAIFIPASAWLSNRFGARNVFACAIALFTVASILCGVSDTLLEFTMARILQGVGGAMMSPVGRIEVMRRTDKASLLRMIAFLTWPGLTGLVVGPPLGGLLTTYLTWRWIFFINIPIGVAGIALVLAFFDRTRAPRSSRFDALGFLLNGAALASLLHGLESIGRGGSTITAVTFLVAGAALGTAALRHASRHPSPLLPLQPMQVETFAIGAVRGGGLFRLGIGGMGFLLPVMFQVIFGMSAFDAGLLVACFLAGDLGIKPVANQIIRLSGFRTTLIADGLIVAATGFAFVFVSPATPSWVLIPLLFFAGASRSVHFTALNALVFADMPQDQIGNASTLNSMIQQVMMGTGVGISAVALALSATVRDHTGAALSLMDFRVAFGLGAVLALASVVTYIPMSPHVGAHVSGHKPA
jgi:EmrB/QacA subfamily drug resistance transporter